MCGDWSLNSLVKNLVVVVLCGWVGGLLGDFLFLGQLHGYFDVRGLFLVVGLLVSYPEEGPADCPEDED